MHYTVVVVGGGPAGLTCARILAEHGMEVLLLERSSTIGTKVCAGGITWSGLINTVPIQIEERRFPVQHIYTRLQHARVTAPDPIIATVNRNKLGRYMADSARSAGVTIALASQVVEISTSQLTYQEMEGRSRHTVTFDFLVGADGSSSRVRRYLGLPLEYRGIGINYQIPGRFPSMEWHIRYQYFGNGYGWIFPHSESMSIGAYADQRAISPRRLKAGLLAWASGKGFNLDQYHGKAEFINYDYRGWNFDPVFLVGDAAGLASGLTGEGIFPAILSAEYVAKHIADDSPDHNRFRRLLKMHKLHSNMVRLTARNRILSACASESVSIALRSGLLDFRKLEMAH